MTYHHIGRSLLSCIILGVSFPSILAAQQLTATDFRPQIASPAFEAGSGPLVLIDEAHNNFHTISPTAIFHADSTMPGRYTAFGTLLRADGLRVEPISDRFSRARLSEAAVLVIANALAPENVTSWALPNPSGLARMKSRRWLNGSAAAGLCS